MSETNDPAGEEPRDPAAREGSLLIRMRQAFPVAWKHDELFRYALILSAVAWMVILFHAGSGTARLR